LGQPGFPQGSFPQSNFGAPTAPVYAQVAVGVGRSRARQIMISVVGSLLGFCFIGLPIALFKNAWREADRKAFHERRDAEEKLKASAPRGLQASDVDAVLRKLRDQTFMTQSIERIRFFSDMRDMAPVEARRDEVTRELVRLAQGKEQISKDMALRCLPRWATPAFVNDLAAIVANDRYAITRHELLEVIAKSSPNAQTASILAPLMAQPGGSFELMPIFKKIGPAAEPVVLDLIKPGTKIYPFEVFQLLGDIGTEKSLPRLKEVAKETAPGASSASFCVVQIEVRLRQK
jgi:hypothetical protein